MMLGRCDTYFWKESVYILCHILTGLHFGLGDKPQDEVEARRKEGVMSTPQRPKGVGRIREGSGKKKEDHFITVVDSSTLYPESSIRTRSTNCCSFSSSHAPLFLAP